jgi:hypothetical protein
MLKQDKAQRSPNARVRAGKSDVGHLSLGEEERWPVIERHLNHWPENLSIAATSSASQ